MFISGWRWLVNVRRNPTEIAAREAKRAEAKEAKEQLQKKRAEAKTSREQKKRENEEKRQAKRLLAEHRAQAKQVDNQVVPELEYRLVEIWLLFR